MNARNYAIAGGVAAAGITIFVALAQSQAIIVSGVSPTILEIRGLNGTYSVGEKANFVVTVKGYGSNCHMLQVQAANQNGERESFYKKADDCRFMAITHGPYNFTRSFEYGNEVMGKQGTYALDFEFKDLVDGHDVSTTRSFVVNTG